MKKNLIASFVCIICFSLLTQPTYSSAINPSSGPTAAEVKQAMKEFKSLSKAERRGKMSEVKKAVKEFKKNKRKGEASTDTVLLVILAILLPPLAVYLHQGEINNKFWISLLLTILFWIPGVTYALIVILGNG
jgi:uncharacterized membrane protein YqaE (UPF0057 family)